MKKMLLIVELEVDYDEENISQEAVWSGVREKLEGVTRETIQTPFTPVAHYHVMGTHYSE